MFDKLEAQACYSYSRRYRLDSELKKFVCRLRKTLRVEVRESPMDDNQGSNLTSYAFYKDLSDGFIKDGLGPVEFV